MELFNKINKYKISILLSILFAAGLFFAEYIRFEQKDYFFIVAIAIVGLTFMYLYLDHLIHINIFRLQNKLNYSEIHHEKHLFRHYIYPILLVTLNLCFIYLIDNRQFTLLINILTSLCFLMTFFNVRSYYENNFLVEAKTHLIYDVLKIYIFFLAAILSYVITVVYNLDVLFAGVFMISIGGFMIFRTFWRHKYNILRSLIVSSFHIVFLLALFIFLEKVLLFDDFQKAVLMTFGYYTISGIVNHEIEGTLSKETVVQYLIWWVIILLLWIGVRK